MFIGFTGCLFNDFQAQLTCNQLRRAKRQTDTQDIEFAMDIMVVFSDKDDRNADSAILERLASRLELRTHDELQAETIAVRKLVKERGGQNAESTQKILDVLKKFKQIAGIEETDVLQDPVIPKAKEESPSTSVVVPHEFLCPISSEIMMDPVIVATGQTYERESILKWLDSNNETCPKTGQPLSDTNLTPNSALKTQIMEWCEKNNYHLPKKEVPPDPDEPITEQQKEIMSLVKDLSSNHLKVQRKAAKKIRLLSKENPENRVMVANLGAIPPLVQLLSYPDSNIREHSVTALLNLSIDEGNKRLITNTDAIPAIIDVLKTGTIGAKENSAAALFSLSMLDENRAKIGAMDGIPPLVELLQNGTATGKKDALTALFNLSLNPVNKGRAIEEGMVKPLLNLVDDKNLGLVDEALSVLLLVAAHPSGRREMAQMPFIQKLVDFIKDGTPKNKECASSVLLELCTNSSTSMLTALQFGVYEYLAELTRTGTSRAQRKAASLLQLMSRSEQIP
uniref:RING-type E3 ubiquitin transferase n=1 Tax=Kalanchoe fedtschenkoi TaxID=63787 RepID=A0A7N0V5W8_KALFE